MAQPLDASAPQEWIGLVKIVLPVVVGGLVALGGVLVGHWMTIAYQRKAHDKTAFLDDYRMLCDVYCDVLTFLGESVKQRTDGKPYDELGEFATVDSRLTFLSPVDVREAFHVAYRSVCKIEARREGELVKLKDASVLTVAVRESVASLRAKMQEHLESVRRKGLFGGGE